ncbi:MAG: class I SAM-dependent methyltransferase [Bacteroidales bacterium]|nr:class I SAM-dependent methyltransferase [Bacteroidales bacterium]
MINFAAMEGDMDRFTAFVIEHEGDDPAELVLRKGRWPDVDVELAAATVAGRRKMRAKAPSWYAVPSLVYPSRLCVEQCSSEAACGIKAEIVGNAGAGRGLRIADLTGGLGLDSWAFSMFCSQVLYVEMDTVLEEAARHNFAALGRTNVEVMNAEVMPEGLDGRGWDTLRRFAPDIIYLDPARRGGAGQKVFKLEDCRPDILQLKDILQDLAPTVMVKLSPMADIDAVLKQLGARCRRMDVISIDNECKELLVTMERSYNGGCQIVADCGRADSFAFSRSEESDAVPILYNGCEDLTGRILLEPDKALLKAGPFKLLSARLVLTKLDVSTHYYIYGADSGQDSLATDGPGSSPKNHSYTNIYKTQDYIVSEDKPSQNTKLTDVYAALFRQFKILRVEPLNNRTLKAIGKEWPCAEVTARNIPLSSDELRRRLGVTPPDTVHIFGLRAAGTPLLLVTERLR